MKVINGGRLRTTMVIAFVMMAASRRSRVGRIRSNRAIERRDWYQYDLWLVAYSYREFDHPNPKSQDHLLEIRITIFYAGPNKARPEEMSNGSDVIVTIS